MLFKEKIETKNWNDVQAILTCIYDRSVKVPKKLKDQMFICVAADGNEELLRLLTTESYKPTLKTREEAFIQGCIDDRPTTFLDIIIGDITFQTSTFDKGLLETVRFRHEKLFNSLLDTCELSEDGMRAALEQAGKPAERRSIPISERMNFSMSFLYEIVYENRFDHIFGNNHYQRRLEEKLHIAPEWSQKLSIYTQTPVIELSPIKNRGNTSELLDLITTLPNQLNDNDTNTTQEN